MTTATATFAVDPLYPHPDVTERYIHYFGTVTITPSTDVYAAGGLALVFSGIPSSGAPAWVEFAEEVLALAGYKFVYVRSTGKLALLQSAGSAAPFAEFGNSAIPAEISTGPIRCRVTFRKGQ